MLLTIIYISYVSNIHIVCYPNALTAAAYVFLFWILLVGLLLHLVFLFFRYVVTILCVVTAYCSSPFLSVQYY